MSDVTRMLDAIDAGEPQTAEQLMPLVYDELRRLAAAEMAREKPGQTLNATALVHEAYLRLVGPTNERCYADRQHFFATAAVAMRRILVDAARRKQTGKRGGKRQDIPIDEIAMPAADPDLVDIDAALDRLAASQPEVARLVELRYFVGLTVPQAATVLGIAPRTADAWWAYAKAWLKTELGDSLPAASDEVR
jgi:RNA polymerase sigma factor (TIGR02999 family)